MSDYRRVAVKWRDAVRDYGSMDLDAAKQGRHCINESVGWLLRSDSAEIVLTAEFCADYTQIRDTTTIPFCMIIDIIDIGT